MPSYDSIVRAFASLGHDLGILGPLYAFPLRVVIPFKSSFGLVMVLLGRVSDPEVEVNDIICLYVVCELSGSHNLLLRNRGLMNQSLVTRGLISRRRVLTMTSSLKELVSSLVVPLRNSMIVSLIPVLILVVLIWIVSVLIFINPWWSEIIIQTIAKQITVTLRLVRITTLIIGSRSIYVLSLANDGWTIIVRMRTTTSFTVMSNFFYLLVYLKNFYEIFVDFRHSRF
nr:hypothetical protein [Tanacetum cinerariifolium]